MTGVWRVCQEAMEARPPSRRLSVLLPQPLGPPQCPDLYSVSGFIQPQCIWHWVGKSLLSAVWRGVGFHVASPGKTQPPTSLPKHQALRLVSNFSGCQPLGVRLKLLIPSHYDMGIRLLLLSSNGLLVCARHFVNEGFLSWLWFQVSVVFAESPV